MHCALIFKFSGCSLSVLQLSATVLSWVSDDFISCFGEEAIKCRQLQALTWTRATAPHWTLKIHSDVILPIYHSQPIGALRSSFKMTLSDAATLRSFFNLETRNLSFVHSCFNGNPSFVNTYNCVNRNTTFVLAEVCKHTNPLHSSVAHVAPGIKKIGPLHSLSDSCHGQQDKSTSMS